MAAGGLQSTGRVQIKGIPLNVSIYKIEAHFQKKKNGGGDVTSVTFPKSSSELDTAIIEFENKQDAVSVLARPQHLQGSLLDLKEYPEEVFEKFEVKMSEAFIKNSKTSQIEFDRVLAEAIETTGVETFNKNSNNIYVKGYWYQIRAFHDKVNAWKRKLSSDYAANNEKQKKASSVTSGDGDNNKQPPSTRRKILKAARSSSQSKNNDSDSTTGTFATNNATSQQPEMQSSGSTVADGESIIMDIDFYAYAKLYCNDDLIKMWEKYHVEVREMTIGQMFKIKVRETSHPASDVKGAVYAMQKFHADLSQNIVRDSYTLKIPDEDGVEMVVQRTMNSLPSVYIAPDSTDTFKVNILACSRDKCQIAKETLSMCCSDINNSQSSIKSTSTNGASTSKQSSSKSPSNSNPVPMVTSPVKPKVNTNTPIPKPRKLSKTSKLNEFSMPLTGIKVSIIMGDISFQECDVLVNTANSKLIPGAGVSGAIFKKGGFQLEFACSKIMKNRPPLQPGEMVETIGKFGQLKCKKIIHVLGPRWNNNNSKKIKGDCKAAMFSILLDILNLTSVDSKTIALPAISTGIHGMPIAIFAHQLVKALDYFAKNVVVTTLKEIKVVIYDEPSVNAMVGEFKASYQKLFGGGINNGGSITKSSSTSSMKSNSSTDKLASTLQRWSTLLNSSSVSAPNNKTKVESSSTDISQAGSSSLSTALDSTNNFQFQPLYKNLAINFYTAKGPCPICLDDLASMGSSGNKVETKTLPCKCSNSTFHKSCIDQALKVFNRCPSCKFILGAVTGTQPVNGQMKSRVENYPLPGYPYCGRIQIQYSFTSGIQGPEHPNPGMFYTGTTRNAFLPNNPEGQKVHELLKKAFQARLIFTIGRSVTTGLDNCVIWADIHHKTSASGGPTAFGYPDPTYLQRVTSELADKGII